jgi:hypothetical protein
MFETDTTCKTIGPAICHHPHTKRNQFPVATWFRSGEHRRLAAREDAQKQKQNQQLTSESSVLMLSGSTGSSRFLRSF